MRTIHYPLEEFEGVENVKPTAPLCLTVYRTEGGLYHSRCSTALSFLGVTGTIEIEFYCMQCKEHVDFPFFLLDTVPVRAETPIYR